MASLLSWRWPKRTFNGCNSWYTSYLSFLKIANYKVCIVIGCVEKFVSHVLVWVKFVVKVITVQNQNSLQSLEFERKTPAKTLGFNTDVLCNVTRDFGDKGVVDLGWLLIMYRYIEDNHRLISYNTTNGIEIDQDCLITGQNTGCCSVCSWMNCQKVSSMQSILCHQSGHWTNLLDNFTVCINSNIDL